MNQDRCTTSVPISCNVESVAVSKDKYGDSGEELAVKDKEVERQHLEADNPFSRKDTQKIPCSHRHLAAMPSEMDYMENGNCGGDDSNMYLPSAIADDSDARTPKARNGHFRIFLCLSVTTIIVGAVGAVLGITMTSKEEFLPSIPYRATLGIRENVARIVGSDQLDDIESAYRKALDWIMFDDPAATIPENPRFVQRFFLAYFYFATSMKKPWDSGCAPSTEKDAPCEFWIVSGSTQEYFKDTRTAFRWLSSVDECSWAGIDCDRSSQVRSINLSTYTRKKN